MNHRLTPSPPEEVLPTLDLNRHLQDASVKQRFVTVMFDVISRRYNQFTRLFSFGMDARWKQQLMTAVGSAVRARVVVDLACGTGDLAGSASERWPGARVVALDVSHRMIRIAAQRFGTHGSRVALGLGDMVSLPFRDRSVDVFTVGYGIRNAPTPQQAIAEISRVLKPGGRLLVLDFYRPSNGLWCKLFLWYLRAAGSVVGWLWHGVPVSYGYIGPSVAGYLTSNGFGRVLEAHGLVVRSAQNRLFGGIALHVAERR